MNSDFETQNSEAQAVNTSNAIIRSAPTLIIWKCMLGETGAGARVHRIHDSEVTQTHRQTTKFI